MTKSKAQVLAIDLYVASDRVEAIVSGMRDHMKAKGVDLDNPPDGSMMMATVPFELLNDLMALASKSKSLVQEINIITPEDVAVAIAAAQAKDKEDYKVKSDEIGPADFLKMMAGNQMGNILEKLRARAESAKASRDGAEREEDDCECPVCTARRTLSAALDNGTLSMTQLEMNDMPEDVRAALGNLVKTVLGDDIAAPAPAFLH